MKIATIKWKDGARYKIAPEKAYEALEKIRAKTGDIDPGAVVEAARKPRHPLHGEFVWDDAAAAQAHREERARSIIRSIVVTYDRKPNTQTRAYEVSVVAASVNGEPPRKAYRTVDDILADPDERNRLLMRAIRELASFQERYHALTELAEVFAAAERAFKRNLETGT